MADCFSYIKEIHYYKFCRKYVNFYPPLLIFQNLFKKNNVLRIPTILNDL